MSDTIEFSDFLQVDLRVGVIEKCIDHPNADRLFVLTVDLGEDEPRIICAGLRPYYKAPELEGLRCVFVVNFAPRNLRGVESNGMILAADGKVLLVEGAAPGTTVG